MFFIHSIISFYLGFIVIVFFLFLGFSNLCICQLAIEVKFYHSTAALLRITGQTLPIKEEFSLPKVIVSAIRWLYQSVKGKPSKVNHPCSNKAYLLKQTGILQSVICQLLI